MVSCPVIAPPAPLARGGGQAGRGRPRGGGEAHFYDFPSRKEAVSSDAVIISIFLVYHRDASVLFDTGSTYSYVSSYFDPYLDISRDYLSAPGYVSTPVGDSSVVDCVYRPCLVIIGSYETRVDMLLLSMVYLDVILGMDWLSPYHAILDCHAKTKTLAMSGLPRLEWRGTLDYISSRVVFFLKAQQMVENGCEAYIAFVRDVSADTPTVLGCLVIYEVCAYIFEMLNMFIT
ncbi:uncharacterized protein [Nicotiana tomentosiformis]|uniref:uncharacterized protein n=1 Tax=Nicotiana tomentosiformis TaxID=4098 RepID=UPI00388CCBE1